MRLTAVWLMPVAAAIERVDQCVASTGCSSSVFTITRSTSASVIERGGVFRAVRADPAAEIAAISMSGSSVLVAVHALEFRRLRLPRREAPGEWGFPIASTRSRLTGGSATCVGVAAGP
jgi:hypothetical protein